MHEEFDCPVHLLDSHKILLGACMIIIGIASVLLNIWIFVAFIKSHLLSFKSHLLVLNLCTACFIRSILGGFLFAGSSALIGRWIFGRRCCILFAFMQQLLGVFQMISLTILCFERYLIIKKVRKEKEFDIKFYIACIIFCWGYAVTFSIPPLLEYGYFGCDTSGTSCTLEWHYINAKQISFNVLLIIFTAVLPVFIILTSLWKCVQLNRRQRSSETEREQRSLTKSTFIAAGIILVLWIPQAILCTWIGLTDFSRSFRFWNSPTFITILAPLSSEAATLVPVLCFLACDPRIRTALLGRCKEDYGIIKKRRSSDFTMITEN